MHCAYDHKFNNGPLILHDIARFVENADVDWEHFWSMADLGDWRNGCELIFALTAFNHIESRAILPRLDSAHIPKHVLNAASFLLLQDFHQRVTIALRTEMGVLDSFWQRLSSLGQRAFPSRYIMAPFVGVDPESRVAWLGYPIWLVVRARQHLFKKLAPNIHRDIQRAVIVDRWLNATP